ncbi:ISL3 family transposase [Enterococcus plantarum]|uniref:ISL3 family transposase n=1 Tax=Enterococcus plantarum TaxID=1077675 RepID=UPI001A8DD4E0|nr:ISL3 family transposase [Enterococcus plantarum]MBO0468895.1 ISL3 family transposase [Enterococcus plantarum]
MNDSIKKMLRLTDKDLMINEVSYETFQNTKTLIVDAVLSPVPYACRNCGSSVIAGNGKSIVVKNGKKETIIRFEQYNHMPMIMRLKKQRYTCKNCQTHWTAQSYFVRPRHSIANHVRYKITSLLTEKVSLSFIAKSCQVSLTTVIRTLKELKSYLPKSSKRILPKVLMVDEFRSHTSTEDKMSFICADGESGKLIDILPTRKLPRLTNYFRDCTNPEKVEFLVTDMNAAYFQLTKSVLPNAKLVIDRFYIVKHMNQAFNDLRIHEMKELRNAGQNSEAEKLKKNWRFLLKNRANINHYEYKTWLSFRAPKYPFLTEAMMIDRLLGFSTPLKVAYPFFHELVEAFRDKESELFFSLLKELPETLDDSFREKLQNLLTYEEGITNAMIYPYSNGKIEAKNTHIKTMKRVSYGFKSFENMRIRIFLINQLIKVK